jgi:hypothetical protein
MNRVGQTVNPIIQPPKRTFGRSGGEGWLGVSDDLPSAREALLDAMSLEGHWTRYDTARAALAAVEAAARG